VLNICIDKKGFGIDKVWKDISNVSPAGQHAMAWVVNRTHLSQVPNAGQHTYGCCDAVWNSACVGPLNFRSRN